MRPEDLRVALRPRTGLEAIALGMTLARTHGAALWAVWLGFVLPLSLLLNLLLAPPGLAWLAGLLLWWLKPMGERAVLELLARATFGQTLSRGEALRIAWRPGALLWPYLLWRRLGLARSLLMPSDQLEGAPPARRRQRRSYLLRQDGATGFLCTWLFSWLEMVLMAGLLGLLALMVPPEMLGDTLRDAWESFRESDGNRRALGFNVLLTLAMAVTGPFYVACGFALYINRRTRSEGWDLELGLRRLARRLAGSVPTLATAGLLLGLVLSLAPLPAPAAVPAASNGMHAAEGNPTDHGQALPEPPARFTDAVTKAYRHPDLGQLRERRVRVQDEPDPAERRRRIEGLEERVPGWLALAGQGVRGLLWALAIAALLALLWRARHWLGWRRSLSGDPAGLRQIPINAAEPLPADPATQARRLWQQGSQRAALSLLYRACVAALSQRLPVPLADGATEAQCLAAAQQLEEAADRQLFAAVVRNWQLAAWAGQLPADAAFEALLQGLQGRRGWL